MNESHWRDAKDFFKRGFIEVLRQAGLLRDLKVLPMFTGRGYSDSEIESYALLLGLSPRDVLNSQRFCKKVGRSEYFRVASRYPRSDLFLDPDTGIRLPGQTDSRGHVTPEEIAALLPERSDRLVLTYEQGFRRDPGDSLRGIVGEKLKALAYYGLASFAYMSVPSVVIATRPEARKRLSLIYSHLRENLQSPPSVVRLWPHGDADRE